MLERILVPLDGSQTAEAVLPHVRRLLRRADSDVIFLRAANPPPGDSFMPTYEETLAAAREYVLGVAERFAREGARAKGVALMGPAAGIILDTAAAEKATLIALATHGRTGLARGLFGSVAEQVLRKSPLPVMAVRPFWSYEVQATARPEDRPIRTLLVPVDGSETSLAVLPAAVEFARLFDKARIVLLHVMTAHDGWRAPGGPAAERFNDRDLADARLREIAAEIRAKELDVLTLVDSGEPSVVILDTARFHGADLIAMATHGRSGVSRVIVGSVTEKVLRGARAPLLVVSVRKAAARKEAV
jgi:nucleotide-binding universal stress UspA family protein